MVGVQDEQLQQYQLRRLSKSDLTNSLKCFTSKVQGHRLLTFPDFVSAVLSNISASGKY